MGLLAPLFLLGAIAVALPFWLHRLQTKSSNRQPFSSAMLLESTEQQVHVRRKLKYLLLLALRVLLLLLLALAFAKPFWPQETGAIVNSAAGTRLVVVDTSVSMGRSGVIEQAREQAIAAVTSAPTGTTIQLATASGSLRILQPASTDSANLRSAADAIEVDAQRLDFGRLTTDIERLLEELPAPVELHLVSDFQRSGMPAQFADVVPTGVSSFVPYPVGTGDPVNWSFDVARRAAGGLEVSVVSEGLMARTADIQLFVNDVLIGSQSAAGPGRTLLSFDGIEFPPGEHRIELLIDGDDDLTADNRWYGVVNVEPPQAVPLLTDNPDGLPVTYLTAALGSLAENGFDVQAMPLAEFDPRVLTRYRWVIVDDLGALNPTDADALDAFVRRGGNVLAFTADRALGRDTLPLSNHALAPASLSSGPETFQPVGRLDAQHPALSATDGWHRVRVSRSVAVELAEDDEVLIELASGEPLLVEQRRESGSLMVMFSAIDNRWNDLPVHAVFVGFMIEAANYLADRSERTRAYLAGDRLNLSREGSAAGQVVDPDGNSVLSLAATAESQVIQLDKPGIYTVYTGNGETRVAVNVDPLESSLATLGEDVLERWRESTYSPGDSGTRASATAGLAADTDSGPEPLPLWPWLLLMLAVIVIAESALGNVQMSLKARTSS